MQIVVSNQSLLIGNESAMVSPFVLYLVTRSRRKVLPYDGGPLGTQLSMGLSINEDNQYLWLVARIHRAPSGPLSAGYVFHARAYLQACARGLSYYPFLSVHDDVTKQGNIK